MGKSLGYVFCLLTLSGCFVDDVSDLFGGAGGQGGNGGENPTSTGGQDTTGGTGGSGGEGSTSSQGGMTSTGGSGGGTTSSTGGEGGTGGTGGSGGGDPTCTSGDPDTVDHVTGISASGNFGLYVHYWDGGDYYTPVNNSDYTFTGEDLPGQVVMAAQSSLIWNTFNGVAPQSVTWHIVTGLPAECKDGDAVTEVCLALVAKSYRCQHTPYNETVDCPLDMTFSSEAQQFSGNNTFPNNGWGVVLLHLSCP